MNIPTEIKLSMYEAWTEEIEEFHRRILLARAYHEGNQPVALTTRQREFLDMNPDDTYCLNICRTIVTTLCDELEVIGFDTSETPDDGGRKKQADFLADVWTKNKMNLYQSSVHEQAVRDSESFVLLEWDDVNRYPVMAVHEAWTSEDVSAWDGSDSGVTSDMVNEAIGNGVGVWVKYKNDDKKQEMEFAVQYFYSDAVDEKGDAIQIHRRTIYYPDKIIREYVDDNGEWSEYQPKQSWVDKSKKPLGIPCAAFINDGARQECWDVFPQQDAINKADVDVQAASDFFGFPTGWITGAYPTTDGKPKNATGSNVFYLQPGQINGFGDKTPDSVRIDKWEASDPTPMMNALKDRIMFVAQITGTPATKFSATAQVASAETLREQKDTLKKRAKKRQLSFGDSWSSVMAIARKIQNAFGAEQYDETVTIETIWKNIETIEELKEQQTLGVPIETLWARLGYSAEKIAAMKKETSYKLQFMKAFWEAYNAASISGVSVEDFARMVGISEDDIMLLAPKSDAIPTTEI